MHYNPCYNITRIGRRCGRATPYYEEYCDICRDRAARGIEPIRTPSKRGKLIEPEVDPPHWFEAEHKLVAVLVGLAILFGWMIWP